MAKVFLDTNLLIDLYERDQPKLLQLDQHYIYISPLSCHILAYVHKLSLPDLSLNHLLDTMGIINLTHPILERALLGPTKDLENNLQLHSAVEANCQFFLTQDKQLLKLAYFGKMKIVNSLV